MRILPVASVLAFLLLAVSGCLDGGSGVGDAEASAAPIDHSVPAPALDAAALVADLRAFAEAHPGRAGNQPDHEAARR